ncbi:hypothetical protein N7520_000217 [Penicillium odoratum]|uniref:uncharacterized protein n=1 Tax=Penicillium odoratum TaxID=1167516 RepID=UPI002546EEB9|nr:uncharacterized protein N7520_000217 [Penicillium odoratum]KAJ5776971.1 hypothetical protein N7520_000217 [Penicillium odoratum]
MTSGDYTDILAEGEGEDEEAQIVQDRGSAQRMTTGVGNIGGLTNKTRSDLAYAVSLRQRAAAHTFGTAWKTALGLWYTRQHLNVQSLLID